MARYLSAPAFAFLFSAAMLGGAYAFQYIGGMQPCQMCHWQRWVHWGIMGAALLALALPRNPALKWIVAIVLMASFVTAGFHAGVEYGWWEGPRTCTSGVVGLEELNAAPSIFDDLGKPTTVVDCSKPAWVMAGISMAGWNALASLGALAVFLGLWRQAK